MSSIVANESVGIKEYEITSYGIDFDVRGLVTRIENEDIVVPDFQRFVWDRKRSSHRMPWPLCLHIHRFHGLGPGETGDGQLGK